jgi:predicted nucleic acid-binding Zn finger protein
MAYNFLTKKAWSDCDHIKGIRPADYHLFPALKKNTIGEKFNEVRAAKMAVKWIVTGNKKACSTKR